MHFPTDWQNDPHFIYLGSESNPHTNVPYDYWLFDRGDGSAEMRYSYTCRHGIAPPDYGSGPICTAQYGDAKSFLDMLEHAKKDYIFGILRAQHFALYYLATRRKPLLGEV